MSRDDAAQRDTEPENTIWLCHVCGTASRGEGISCEICFRTVCPFHLQRASVYNSASGLYEFTSVCTACQLAKMM